MSNYCGECEHLDEETFDKDKSRRCPLQQFLVFADHPACRKFSLKKRTCGECVNPFWRGKDGVCFKSLHTREGDTFWLVMKDWSACNNFKGSEVRWYPD